MSLDAMGVPVSEIKISLDDLLELVKEVNKAVEVSTLPSIAACTPSIVELNDFTNLYEEFKDCHEADLPKPCLIDPTLHVEAEYADVLAKLGRYNRFLELRVKLCPYFYRKSSC